MPLAGISTWEGLRLGLWEMSEDENALRRAIGFSQDLPYKSHHRRIEVLATRSLAHQMGLNPDEIGHRDDGMPLLPEGKGFISLSHSQHWAGLLLSPFEGIGIDIEEFRPRLFSLAERFLNQAELDALPPNPDLPRLTALWCAKEAVIKANGRNSIDWRDEIRLNLSESPLPTERDHPFRGCTTFLTGEARADGRLYRLMAGITERYAVAVCLPKKA